MKNSLIKNLLCAAALTVSFASFAGDRKKAEPVAKATTTESAIYKIKNTEKVRLLVGKNDEGILKVVLKDEAGKIYYAEKFNRKMPQNSGILSLVFNLAEMTDGAYYFELHHNGVKTVKEVNIESSVAKTISL